MWNFKELKLQSNMKAIRGSLTVFVNFTFSKTIKMVEHLLFIQCTFPVAMSVVGGKCCR